MALTNIMKFKSCPQRGENCNPDDCAHWKNTGKAIIPCGYGGYDTEEAETGICRLWNDIGDSVE